jgi:hypothetical protein
MTRFLPGRSTDGARKSNAVPDWIPTLAAPVDPICPSELPALRQPPASRDARVAVVPHPSRPRFARHTDRRERVTGSGPFWGFLLVAECGRFAV